MSRENEGSGARNYRTREQPGCPGVAATNEVRCRNKEIRLFFPRGSYGLMEEYILAKGE